MSTTLNKIPKQARIPDKVVELTDSREFDGVVDIDGQPWVQVDGQMYPIKKTKLKRAGKKLTVVGSK